MGIRINGKGWAGLALAALFIALWLLYPKVYSFSDQTGYLFHAHQLNITEDWDGGGAGNHRVGRHRFGLLLPHWAAYRLFGVSHFSSFLPQLGFLLVILFTVLRYCDTLLQRLAAALMLAPLLPYAADAMPDLGVACCMFLALALLDRRREGAGYGALFSLVALYAFLIKLTAYFLVVPWLAALLLDARAGLGRDGGRRGFHIGSVVTGLLLLATYLLLYHHFYGDAFARFVEINRTAPRHLWNIQGLDAYLHRFFVAPTGVFYGLFGIAFFLALAQALLALFGDGRLKLVAIYFLAGLLLANFSPTSLVTWQPLPLGLPRMFLFLTPAVAVLAAQLVSDLAHGGHFHRLRLGARRRAAARLGAAALSLALLLALAWKFVLPLSTAISQGLPDLERARQLAAQRLAENGQTALILSEDRTRHRMAIYAGFDPAFHDRALLCDTTPFQDDGRAPIVLLDLRLSRFLERAYGHANCNADLMALARAQGHRLVFDTPDLFLSFPKRPAP